MVLKVQMEKQLEAKFPASSPFFPSSALTKENGEREAEIRG